MQDKSKALFKQAAQTKAEIEYLKNAGVRANNIALVHYQKKLAKLTRAINRLHQ